MNCEVTPMDEKRFSTDQTALILIDLQNDFCHPNGTASRRGTDLQLIKPVFPQIKKLLKGARKQNIPIIHAISEHSVWTDSPSQKERLGRTNQSAEFTYCEPGSWGAEIYQLFTPLQQEKTVVKHRYSAFYHTDLALILRSLHVKHIILVGLYTNVCVDSTARDGYMRDFFVTVPKDCVVSNDPQKHSYALDLLTDTFAEVVSSDKILNAWK